MEEENIITLQISVDGENWKDVKCQVEPYEWRNYLQKKKTLNLIKRLSVRAIIYAAIHD